VQWDYLGKDILHVDFARVAADEKIHLEVRVEIRGVAPGIAQGGNLVQPLHSLHVECLVTNIPESIRVSVAELQLNQAIHVNELKLPEGVAVSNDPDAIVVQVSLAKVEAEEAAVPVAEGSAEPEIIGKKPEEGEEAAEEKK
jgi:large subunit ribosomal protein L25